MEKLKVLDLFSGIGMFSYGLHKTGLYETVAFCEWDKKCRDVLQTRFPGVDIHQDIKFLEYNSGCLLSCDDNAEITRTFTVPDVIVGGFPCQDISSANMSGSGVSGEKSNHWIHYARLIDEIKPRGVIIENVSRLASRGLDRVLHDLAKIGYDAEWYSFRASDFGAPCKRERLFIVAHPPCVRWGYEIPLEQALKKGQELHRQRDLQEICNRPFGRSGSVPQPLLRGVDVRGSGWVDRLKQVGNTVYWPIVEQLGYHLYENVQFGNTYADIH